MFGISLAVLLSCVASTGSPVGDELAWARFRGPNGTGVALPGTELPSDISGEKRVLWRVEVPHAYSSPVVAGEKVFLTAFHEGKLLTLAYALADGKELWRAEAPADHEVKRNMLGNPAAPSPVTDGKDVWVCFEDVGVLRYSGDGKLLWKAEIGKHRIPHGLAQSPILEGSLVLQQIDADSGSYLLAFDRETGKQLWRTKRPGVLYGYSTPSIHRGKDGAAEVIVSGSYRIEAFDLKAGERKWSVDGACWNACALPIVAGDKAFVLSYTGTPQEYRAPKVDLSWEEMKKTYDKDGDGKVTVAEWEQPGLDQLWFLFDLNDDKGMDAEEYAVAQLRARATGGLFALDLGAKDEAQRRLWTRTEKRGLPEMPSPVLVGETLFLINDGLLSSIDAKNGEIVKQERIGDTSTNYASLVAAGEKLLVTSHSGRLTVVSAKPQWEVLSHRELGEEELWATPALVGDRIVVRSEEALWCLSAR
ncbi:MAG: PQQ-binding-like beta-propeller repeat protein [Planctomycetes bacterium]|nr:PQQ-binding-like beta-propeller repeat protein [Planctomycetota bacterium]